MPPEDNSDVAISTENYAHIPAHALDSFGRYLSEVAAPNIGIEIQSQYDHAADLNARIEENGDGKYIIRIFGGLISVLSIVHAAVEQFPDSGANGTYASLADSLSRTTFVEGLPDPISVTNVLQTSMFLSLFFCAFHEFAHLRAGHFNKLYPAAKRAKGQRQFCIGESGEEQQAAKRIRATTLAVTKHMELEADILAFDTLIRYQNEIWMDERCLVEADLDVRRAQRDQFRRESVMISELVLYASCLCLCILELNRKEHGGERGYPRPFTRVLSLFRQFVISTRDHLEIEDRKQGRFTVHFAVSQEEMETYAEILVNAVDFCNFCCEIAGLKMREQYQLESDADFLNEALFFAHLVEGEVPFRTPEARELSSLDSTAIRFRRMMRRYRVEPWDVL